MTNVHGVPVTTGGAPMAEMPPTASAGFPLPPPSPSGMPAWVQIAAWFGFPAFACLALGWVLWTNIQQQRGDQREQAAALVVRFERLEAVLLRLDQTLGQRLGNLESDHRSMRDDLERATRGVRR